MNIEQMLYVLWQKFKKPIKTATVSANVGRKFNSKVALTAPTVRGYTFLCWVEAYTAGWLGSIGIENPTAQTTNFWVNGTYYGEGTGVVWGMALYVRSDIA